MSDIRTKPSNDHYRSKYDDVFGKNDSLPKGGKKRFSMEDLRKEREAEVKAEKKK